MCEEPYAGYSHDIALIRQARRPEGVLGLELIALMDHVNAGVQDRIARMLPDITPYEVLEVGFGGTGMRDKLSRWFAHYTGVDWSETAVERARAAPGFGTFLRASVDDMPLRAASFDLVLAVNTVYWWPDLDRGLREVRRVLKPHAVLVIGSVIPDVVGEVGKTAMLAVREAGATYYSSSALVAAMACAGFTAAYPITYTDMVDLGAGHEPVPRNYAIIVATAT